MDSFSPQFANGLQTTNGGSVIQEAIESALSKIVIPEGQLKPLNEINNQLPLTGNINVYDSGYTMLVGTPNQNLHVANKQYVDQVASSSGSIKDRIISTGQQKSSIILTDSSRIDKVNNIVTGITTQNLKDVFTEVNMNQNEIAGLKESTVLSSAATVNQIVNERTARIANDDDLQTQIDELQTQVDTFTETAQDLTDKVDDVENNTSNQTKDASGAVSFFAGLAGGIAGAIAGVAIGNTISKVQSGIQTAQSALTMATSAMEAAGQLGDMVEGAKPREVSIDFDGIDKAVEMKLEGERKRPATKIDNYFDLDTTFEASDIFSDKIGNMQDFLDRIQETASEQKNIAPTVAIDDGMRFTKEQWSRAVDGLNDSMVSSYQKALPDSNPLQRTLLSDRMLDDVAAANQSLWQPKFDPNGAQLGWENPLNPMENFMFDQPQINIPEQLPPGIQIEDALQKRKRVQAIKNRTRLATGEEKIVYQFVTPQITDFEQSLRPHQAVSALSLAKFVDDHVFPYIESTWNKADGQLDQAKQYTDEQVQLLASKGDLNVIEQNLATETQQREIQITVVQQSIGDVQSTLESRIDDLTLDQIPIVTSFDMHEYKITNLAPGTNPGDAITKQQLEDYSWSAQQLQERFGLVEQDILDLDDRVTDLENNPGGGSATNQINNTSGQSLVKVEQYNEVAIVTNGNLALNVFDDQHIAISKHITTDLALQDEIILPEQTLVSKQLCRHLLNDQESVVNAYTDQKCSQEAQTRQQAIITVLDNSVSYTDQQIQSIQNDIDHRMARQSDDVTQLRATNLGILNSIGAPHLDPILNVIDSGDDTANIIIKGRVISVLDFSDIQYGTREYLTLGAAYSRFYNKESVDYKDTTTLNTAKSYADSLLVGFDLTNQNTTTGFNVSEVGKNIELINDTDNYPVTGLVITEQLSKIKGDLIFESNLDLGGLSYEQRQQYAVTAKYIDDFFMRALDVQNSIDFEKGLREQGDSHLQGLINTINSAGYQNQSQVQNAITNSLVTTLLDYYNKAQCDAIFQSKSSFYPKIVSTDGNNQIQCLSGSNGIEIKANGTIIGKIMQSIGQSPATPLLITATDKFQMSSGSGSYSLYSNSGNSNNFVIIASGSEVADTRYDVLQLGGQTNTNNCQGLVLSTGKISGQSYSLINLQNNSNLNNISISPETSIGYQNGTQLNLYGAQFTGLQPIQIQATKKMGYAPGSGVVIDQATQFVTKNYCDQTLRLTSGYYNCNNNRLALVGNPTNTSDAVNLSYLQSQNYTKTQVDNLITTSYSVTKPLSQISIDQELDMGTNMIKCTKIWNLNNPTAPSEACNKAYADSLLSGSNVHIYRACFNNPQPNQFTPFAMNTTSGSTIQLIRILGSGDSFFSGNCVWFRGTNYN